MTYSRVHATRKKFVISVKYNNVSLFCEQTEECRISEKLPKWIFDTIKKIVLLIVRSNVLEVTILEANKRMAY